VCFLRDPDPDVDCGFRSGPDDVYLQIKKNVIDSIITFIFELSGSGFATYLPTQTYQS